MSIDLSEKIKLNTGFAASGWEDVGNMLESAKTGAFLKLSNNEEAILTFAGAPLAYVCHRVPSYDSNGQPKFGRDGAQMERLVLCDNVYHDRECAHCKAGAEVSIRTCCEVAILVMKDGALDVREFTVLEGGPKLWKNRIVPSVNDAGPNGVYKLRRIGEGLQTDYQFIASTRLKLPKAVTEKIEAQERVNLLDILKLNDGSNNVPAPGAEDVPF